MLKAGGTAAAALAMAQLVAACAPSGRSSGGNTVVRMWSWYKDQQDEFPKLIKAFEEKDPSIKTENRIFGTPDQYLLALQAAAEGDVPEIFAPRARALVCGTPGISADPTKELGSTFLQDFFDSADKEYTTGGKQYAVGWLAQTFGIFYNPDLLAAPGRARRGGMDRRSERVRDFLASDAGSSRLSVEGR